MCFIRLLVTAFSHNDDSGAVVERGTDLKQQISYKICRCVRSGSASFPIRVEMTALSDDLRQYVDSLIASLFRLFGTIEHNPSKNVPFWQLDDIYKKAKLNDPQLRADQSGRKIAYVILHQLCTHFQNMADQLSWDDNNWGNFKTQILDSCYQVVIPKANLGILTKETIAEYDLRRNQKQRHGFVVDDLLR